MTNETIDTRPSMFGGYKFKLSPKQQARAHKKFEKFYKEQAQKLVWNNNSSVNTSGIYYPSYAELKRAMLKNVDKNSTENCLGLAHHLQRKLEKLKLPVVIIFVNRSDIWNPNFGHVFVAYRCNGKNYCADLCSATRGCERRRGATLDMWAEPMETHLASYLRSGFVGVRFGTSSYELTLFKEFDAIREHLKRRVRLADYKRLPFFDRSYTTMYARRAYTDKIDFSYRPVNFEKVGLTQEDHDLEEFHAPPELIAASKRPNRYSPDNYLDNVYVNKRAGTVHKRSPVRTQRLKACKQAREAEQSANPDSPPLPRVGGKRQLIRQYQAKSTVKPSRSALLSKRQLIMRNMAEIKARSSYSDLRHTNSKQQTPGETGLGKWSRQLIMHDLHGR